MHSFSHMTACGHTLKATWRGPLPLLYPHNSPVRQIRLRGSRPFSQFPVSVKTKISWDRIERCLSFIISVNFHFWINGCKERWTFGGIWKHVKGLKNLKTSSLHVAFKYLLAYSVKLPTPPCCSFPCGKQTSGMLKQPFWTFSVKGSKVAHIIKRQYLKLKVVSMQILKGIKQMPH